MRPHYGIETSLLFNRATGVVGARDGYTVVRSPELPDFYFGNLLVLPGRPRDAGRALLEADFARLIGAPPRINHRTFMWPVFDDDPQAGAALDDWLAAGYEYDEYPVLLAEAGDLRAPPHACPGLSIRAYDG
ncbi:MAG TPA: GNAT family N-acetyltransferase, partial [Burkholderiaceae bacterium]